MLAVILASFAWLIITLLVNNGKICDKIYGIKGTLSFYIPSGIVSMDSAREDSSFIHVYARMDSAGYEESVGGD